MMTGDLSPAEMKLPRLCRTCVYHRFVAPPIGIEDMPRLRGVRRNGHSEPPCTLCSCNPHYKLLYCSDGGTRRLRELGQTTLVRIPEEVFQIRV
jgi:hypothetical protein